MPGLVPGIYVFAIWQDVDGRDKPGHDVEATIYAALIWRGTAGRASAAKSASISSSGRAGL